MSGEILKWKSELDVLANTNVEKDSDQSGVRRNPEREIDQELVFTGSRLSI